MFVNARIQVLRCKVIMQINNNDNPKFDSVKIKENTVRINNIQQYFNDIINGCCRITQRDNLTYNITTTQIGQVDRFICGRTNSGFSVTAGTISKSDNTNAKSGKCLKIANITSTGSGAPAILSIVH